MWKDGQPHNKGILTFSNDTIYDGEYFDGYPDGPGTMIFKMALNMMEIGQMENQMALE